MKTFYTVLALTMFSTVAISGCGSTNNSAPAAPSAVTNNTNQPNSTQSSSGQSTAPTVKEGVAKLLSTAKELSKSINANDEAKIKENGPKLEEVWSSFEDGVKSQYPDLYEKIEKYLNPEVAGSQVTPLDKQTLGNLNDQLTQTLNEAQQKLQ